MHPYSRYLAVLLAGAFTTVLLSAAVNYTVDPYRLFGAPERPGFNVIKPASAERTRVFKPYLAERAAARTVIAGNSRPEVGLDPASPCWSPSLQPILNMGIPGANLATQARYALHAAEEQGEQIFLAVDFLDFLDVPSASQTDSAPPSAEFLRTATGQDAAISERTAFMRRAEDRLSGLFSLQALADSIGTVLAQRDGLASTRRADGFNPARDYEKIIRHEGQAVLFTQKNAQISASFANPALQLDAPGGEPGSAFAALQDFLNAAQKRGLRVTLFINPYHLDYLRAIKDGGKWPLFEEWKRTLARMAEAAQVPLWDFNTVDAYSTEAVPPRGDRKSMLRWYWEPAHYRAELGELMIARMQERSCDSAPGAAELGVRLDATTLEPQLVRLRDGMAAQPQRRE